MLSGFFLGVGGAIFSVGVTSVPKYFSKDKVGLANGIYGMGNIGTAVFIFSTTYCRYYRLANDGKKLFNYHCYFRNFNVHFGDKMNQK